MITKAKIQETAEKLGWIVEWHGYGAISFRRRTTFEHTFSFEVGAERVREIIENIDEYLINFDVSQEAYYLLGHNGHGKWGAPYEMIDVYNDMAECKRRVCQLLEALKECDCKKGKKKEERSK